MGFSNRFCGIHIRKYARIVAIIGILFSCISLILSIFAWNYFPMSIALLLAFVLGLLGLNKSKPGYLLAADIILGISIFLVGFLMIASLIIAIAAPQEFFDDFHKNQIYSDWNGDSTSELRVAYFILAFILMIVFGLLIFAFVVFQKARKYLLEHPRRCSLFPDTFVEPRPVQRYGFYSNSPMGPQDYNGNQSAQYNANQQVYNYDHSPPSYYQDHLNQVYNGSEVVLQVQPSRN